MILKNTKFKYRKAREMILDAILSGDLAPDSFLPSEQKLCDKLGVSRITLRAALHELEQDGIIIKRNGRPSQVNPEALRKQHTPLRRIAWVDTSPIGYTNQIYFDIFRSVSEQAVLRNVKLDYISLYASAMAENFFRRQNEYDGLILGEFSRELKKYIPRITHPNTICVDCPRPGIPHCVKTDCYLGGQLAAETLLKSGHRRLACLGYAESEVDYPPFQERLRGFCDHLDRAGCPLAPERILTIVTAEDENDFTGFLKKHQSVLKKSDGLFVLMDRFAIGAIDSLPELGLRIPDDLAIVGFDGQIYSRFVSPVLTTIQQPVEEIGQKALEIVLNPSESASFPEIVQIPPVLQNGATVSTKNDKSPVSTNTTNKARKGTPK